MKSKFAFFAAGWALLFCLTAAPASAAPSNAFEVTGTLESLEKAGDGTWVITLLLDNDNRASAPVSSECRYYVGDSVQETEVQREEFIEAATGEAVTVEFRGREQPASQCRAIIIRNL